MKRHPPQPGTHSSLKSLLSFFRYAQERTNVFFPQLPILKHFKPLEELKDSCEEHLRLLHVEAVVVNVLTHLLSIYPCIVALDI